MDSQTIDDMKKRIIAMEGFFGVSTIDDLTLEELFNPSFMNQLTFAQTIQNFINNGNFDIKCLADFNKIPKETLDKFVFEQTSQFESFDEFITAARLFWLENFA